MIQVQNTQYGTEREKKILEWLRQPACKLFLEHLAEQAAQLTADAGNLLVRSVSEEAEPDDEQASKLAAKAATQLNDAIKIIQTIKGEHEEYKFEGVDLSPKPVLEIIPDANQLHQSTPN